MFIKKIKYTDFLGTEREETFYFNLSKTEVMRMNAKCNDQYVNMLERMVKAKNLPEMWENLEDLIFKSYGELADDGIHLVKKGGLLAESFAETPAYDALVDWFLEDPEKNMAEFVNNVFPSTEIKQDDKPQLAVVK